MFPYLVACSRLSDGGEQDTVNHEQQTQKENKGKKMMWHWSEGKSLSNFFPSQFFTQALPSECLEQVIILNVPMKWQRQSHNKKSHTAPLRSKLPVASHFLPDKNRVACHTILVACYQNRVAQKSLKQHVFSVIYTQCNFPLLRCAHLSLFFFWKSHTFIHDVPYNIQK